MTCFSSFFAIIWQKMKKNTSWKFTDESSVTFQSSVSGPSEFGLYLAWLKHARHSPILVSALRNKLSLRYLCNNLLFYLTSTLKATKYVYNYLLCVNVFNLCTLVVGK